MDRNDLAVGLKNVIAEGDAAVKEFLALFDKPELESLYDSMDEYLVSLENAPDEEEEEDEEAEEEDDDDSK